MLVVPLIEEMFLRGFVMRYTQAERWWTVPWGVADRTALMAATVIPVLLHPAEALAAAVWFGMIHWLYLRTKNIWDCVAAHAVTNLLLGLYVLEVRRMVAVVIKAQGFTPWDVDPIAMLPGMNPGL